MSNDQVEPGWYDDGSGTVRWWDGSQWTQQTGGPGGAGAPGGDDATQVGTPGGTTAFPQQDPYGSGAGAPGAYPGAGGYGDGGPGGPGGPGYGQGGFGQGGYGAPGGPGGPGGWEPGGPSGGSGGGKGKLYGLIGGGVALVVVLAIVLGFFVFGGDDSDNDDTADENSSESTTDEPSDEESTEDEESDEPSDEPSDEESTEDEETEEPSDEFAVAVTGPTTLDLASAPDAYTTIEVEGGGPVVVLASNGYSDLDIELTIIDADGTYLCEGTYSDGVVDEELSGEDETCLFDAEPGEYYIEVGGYSDTTSSDPAGSVEVSAY